MAGPTGDRILQTKAGSQRALRQSKRNHSTAFETGDDVSFLRMEHGRQNTVSGHRIKPELIAVKVVSRDAPTFSNDDALLRDVEIRQSWQDAKRPDRLTIEEIEDRNTLLGPRRDPVL